ncbi:MAG: exopolysaccharide transport family protein [Beijerinckiaceae bacterium]
MTAAELRSGSLAFLRRNWRLIVATTAAVVLVGALYAVFAPVKYRSAAQLLIDPRGLQILKNEITRSGDSTDGNLVDIENQRYILLSRSILQQVVDQQKLEDNPMFGGGQPGMLSRIAASLGIRKIATDRRARAVQALADMVEVVRNERAYVLDVVVTTPNPELSATLANVIARTYLEAQNEAKSEIAKRASEDLSKRAEELRKQVQTAEADVERYRAEHDLVQTPTGRLLGEQQITDLSSQLGLIRARIADAQAKVDAVDRARKGGISLESLNEALSSPTMTGLRAQYAQAAQQEASLATQLGPRHPALIQAQEQMRDIKRQISAELDRIAAAARTDLARAKSSELSLQRQSGDVRVSNDKNNVALVELRDLERAAEASRTVYQAFLGRAKELGESQGIDSTNARVISPAIPAAKPAGASGPLILAGSLLFGLTLGMSLAYARERLDDRIRSRRQLLELTGLPVLATFATQARTGDRAGRRALAPDRATFRDLLARLGVQAEADQRSVALVSRHRTALSTQLVAGLAEFARWEDLDVVVVDCGGASSQLADAFEQNAAAATRRGDVRVVQLANIMRTGSQRRLRTEFDRIAAEADVILFDVPPPDEDRDAPAILDLVDSIVPVFEAGELDRNVIASTIEGLADHEERVAGVVVIGELAAA